MLLAQLVLRPMHVIRSSLSRLGRGDLGATLDLRDDEEFRELGDVFDQVSAQLRAASPEGHQAGAARRAVAPHRDGRPAHRRRRARDEEPAERDDDSSRAAEAEAGGGEVGVAARRDHRAGDSPPRRAHPGLPEIRAARRSDVRPGRDRAARVERARRGRSPRRSAPACRSPAAAPTAALLVEGDAAQLRDVFLNLAQNAIQAMPKGGRLGISCAALPNRRVRVRVEDTGVGHRAREPDEDFRAVLHDQGTRHRRRFVDGVSDGPDPQRRDRRRIDARRGDDVYRRITCGRRA